MTAYIFRRLLTAVPVVFLVITLVFFLFQLIPGDAARMYLGLDAPQEAVDRLRAELALDRSVLIQYFAYLVKLAHGDLGKSIFTHQPVIAEINTHIWNTVQLSLGAILFATVFGLSMGLIAAAKRGTFWDYCVQISVVLGISIPSFWLGLLLIYFFSVKLNLLPSVGNATWQHYVLPTFCLSVFSLAFIARITRSCVVESIRQDYVRTARAKGLSESMVLVQHALRNALLPIVTVVGLRFGYMLGGAMITESVFAWPGMGRLLITAVRQRDIPVVQGALLVFAISFVLVNLMADVAYSFVDPEIRY